VAVLFYFRSDGQYILVSDAIMAVVLFIIILSAYLSIRSSHSIIINTNTAIIVSPIKIYCPFDLKKKRTPTVYQNVTQHNNKKKHILCDVLIDSGRFFFLRSDGKYI
jgi:hypothetical protein